MTAPARTVDERIIDLLLSGRGIDYVSEQGIVWGWTRQRALHVIAGQGWSLNRAGRLAHLEPPRAPFERPRPRQMPRPRLQPAPAPPTAVTPPSARVVRLSGAQRAVVDQLCEDGATNRVIGERLHISEDTVKCHMKAALTAARCGSRTELAVAILTGQVEVTRAQYGQAARA